MSSRIAQLKTCRILASDITEKGANLYDLLLKELEVTREARSQVISRPFELKEMVVAINDSIRTMQDSTSSIKSALQNLEADEASLVGKIEKKKIELDRAEKRLKSLKVVRPAYMDEYERIEVELAKLYDSYIEKYRNLTYLENQLEEHNRQEQEKAEVKIWIDPLILFYPNKFHS